MFVSVEIGLLIALRQKADAYAFNFSLDPNDLSQCNNINEFVRKFKIVCENSLNHLDKISIARKQA